MNTALPIENQRIKILREHLKLSQGDFAAKLGRKQGSISDIERGRNSIDGIVQPLEFTLNVNIDWLKTGEGPMFNSKNSNAKPIAPLDYPIDLRDDDGNTKFIDLGEGQNLMIVPLVNEYAHMGYLAGYSDPEYIEQLPKASLIVPKYKGFGNYMAFEAVGESMENFTTEEMARKSILHGSRVFAREVPQHQWQYRFHMHEWDAWVIVHKTDGILIKEMIAHDVKKAEITLHSLNPDKDLYPDQSYSLNDIKQVFNVIDVARGRGR